MTSLSPRLTAFRRLRQYIKDIITFHNGVLITIRCLNVCRPRLSGEMSPIATVELLGGGPGVGAVEVSRRYADGWPAGMPWVGAKEASVI